MSETVILSVKGISKTFGGLKALSDVSFDVYQGEIYGIIGPNGSGKTTTGELHHGVYQARRGSCLFSGRGNHPMAGPQDRPGRCNKDLSDHEALLFTARLQKPDHTTLVAEGKEDSAVGAGAADTATGTR